MTVIRVPHGMVNFSVNGREYTAYDGSVEVLNAADLPFFHNLGAVALGPLETPPISPLEALMAEHEALKAEHEALKAEYEVLSAPGSPGEHIDLRGAADIAQDTSDALSGAPEATESPSPSEAPKTRKK